MQSQNVHTRPQPMAGNGLWRTFRCTPPYYACDRCGCPVRSARQLKASDPVVCAHCKTDAELRELHARKANAA